MTRQDSWWWLLLTVGLVTSQEQQTVYPKLWAFLASGSSGYYNYRHQADICHAYQVLHENGIPDENIIVMMADDIAYNEDNPTPGIILNEAEGKNVYRNVLKDYTKQDVTAENFLNILSGNKSAMSGIGSGRVIESGPDDVIFLNFVDHGGPGILCFGNDDILSADVLIDTLKNMASKRKFAKMFMYIEACHSGSMFDDLLSDDLNVIVMTAADPHENSFACYYDSKRETYLADVFSASWMHDTEHESLPQQTVHHQFEKVRTWTNTSHVEEYGDLDIGSTKLSHVLGFRMKNRSGQIYGGPNIPDAVSNLDVPIQIIENKLEETKDIETRRRLKLKRRHILKMRKAVDDLMDDLVHYLTGDNIIRKQHLNEQKYSLKKHHFPCYKSLLKRFSTRCFSVAEHPYVRAHLHKLVNMCSSSWMSTSNALDAILSVCKSPINFGTTIM